MARRPNRWAAVAAVTALALAAAACGRSAPSASGGGGSSSAGNVSPTKGLVTTSPAGTKTVSSMTWAVYRDVNSLDPIYAFDYPENTAMSLMCESLLRQAPDGSVRARPGHDHEPVADHDRLHAQARGEVLGRQPGHRRRRRLQPEPQHGPEAGRLLPRGVHPGVQSITGDRRNQVTITLKQPDYWLEGELASMPGVVIEKSVRRSSRARTTAPRPGRSCAPARTSSKSFTPGVGVVAVGQPGLLGRERQAPGPADHAQGRAGHLDASPRAC